MTSQYRPDSFESKGNHDDDDDDDDDEENIETGAAKADSNALDET